MVLFEKDIDGDTWLSQVPDSYYLFFMKWKLSIESLNTFVCILSPKSWKMSPVGLPTGLQVAFSFYCIS